MTNKEVLKKTTATVKPVISILVFIAIWQIISLLHIWEDFLLPSPHHTFLALTELAFDGLLVDYISISLIRFLCGYIIALAFAIPLGLLLGWFVNTMKYANPILQVLRPISPTAWFPFIVLWFGIGNAPAIAIITIAAFFPILFSTISAIGHIDPTLLKVSNMFGLSRLQFFIKVAIPAAFPQIMVGLHIAIGTAWIFLVSGEMVGSQSGLGYLIVDARNNLRNDMVLAGIFLIGFTGWAIDSLMRHLEHLIGKKWGATDRE